MANRSHIVILISMNIGSGNGSLSDGTSKALLHSSEGNIIRRSEDTDQLNKIEWLYFKNRIQIFLSGTNELINNWHNFHRQWRQNNKDFQLFSAGSAAFDFAVLSASERKSNK